MKRWFTPMYWSLAVPLTALVLWSAMGSLGRAFFLSVTLLPGVLFFKYFAGDISFTDRRCGIIHSVYFVAAVMLIEYLGIFFVYFNVDYPYTDAPPGIVMNPLFIWLLLGALLSIEYLLKSRFVSGRESTPPKFVTFTSNRRRQTLELASILYIESRDDEVTVFTTDGSRHPTRMKISQWEATLDERFVRLHRSFIVNRLHVTRTDAHAVWLGDTRVEVSRKYRDRMAAI